MQWLLNLPGAAATHGRTSLTTVTPIFLSSYDPEVYKDFILFFLEVLRWYRNSCRENAEDCRRQGGFDSNSQPETIGRRYKYCLFIVMHICPLNKPD